MFSVSTPSASCETKRIKWFAYIKKEKQLSHCFDATKLEPNMSNKHACSMIGRHKSRNYPRFSHLAYFEIVCAASWRNKLREHLYFFQFCLFLVYFEGYECRISPKHVTSQRHTSGLANVTRLPKDTQFVYFIVYSGYDNKLSHLQELEPFE